ncbi:hypothetical protein [Actinoplanes utahensis]|uniref:hypothetical protein n=1 Tax=Actinoplanes utahensis TaxID=1869 RepID=UPI00068C9310|nr:hypothetical protein [Actinoplanes utahensis]GIF27019.1 hypothetical protein Aut01nite_00050 [Actinoplanes utahensis]
MAFLLIVLAILLTAAVLPLWRQPRDAPEPEDARAERGPEPTTLEGALAAQLISGEIGAAQYRVAVARLAARDEERNPMSVPDA